MELSQDCSSDFTTGLGTPKLSRCVTKKGSAYGTMPESEECSYPTIPCEVDDMQQDCESISDITESFADAPATIRTSGIAYDEYRQHATSQQKVSRNCRSRAYAFTVNVTGFFTELIKRQFDDETPKDIGVTYLCFQEEIAPETGKRHYQGYVHFINQRKFLAARAIIAGWFGNITPHIEVAKGTPKQNRDYCSKDGGTNFFEFGQLPQPGARTDLYDLVKEVIAGKSIKQIADKFPVSFIKFHRGIKELHTLQWTKPRDSRVDPIVYWLCGRSGVGKSLWAWTNYPDLFCMTSGKWWDTYQGQSVVLMDDYRPTWGPFEDLLLLLDRYQHRIEIKGGFTQLSASAFVITTTSRPEVMWHDKTKEDLEQLLRRITRVGLLTKDGLQILMNRRLNVVRRLKNPTGEKSNSKTVQSSTGIQQDSLRNTSPSLTLNNESEESKSQDQEPEILPLISRESISRNDVIDDPLLCYALFDDVIDYVPYTKDELDCMFPPNVFHSYSYR